MGQTSGPRLTHQSLRILRAFIENAPEHLTGADLIRQTGLMSGTVYPVLLRFEEQGLLRSKWEREDPSSLGRPRRRLYRLTAEGQKLARRALQDVTLDGFLPVAGRS